MHPESDRLLVVAYRDGYFVFRSATEQNTSRFAATDVDVSFASFSGWTRAAVARPGGACRYHRGAL